MKEIIQYKNGNSSLVLLGSNKKVINKFAKEYGKVLADNIVIGDGEKIAVVGEKKVIDSQSSVK